jgi:hypothetical protein
VCSAPELGMGSLVDPADASPMIWPAAALAVFLLGFVVFYGSVLQSRLGTTDGASDALAGAETDD